MRMAAAAHGHRLYPERVVRSLASCKLLWKRAVMTVLDELEAAVTAIAERVGPAVAGLGRGWGRGSGVVIAPGRVLTSAHVLRGDEVAVTVGGGELAHGRVAGADGDLDLAVVSVDTGDTPAVAWEPDVVAGLRPGRPVFALADPGGRGTADDVRARDRHRALVPRPPRAPHRRVDRAFRAASARLLRRPPGRRRRPPARHQRRAHGGRAAARGPRRRRRCAAASRRWPAARRRARPRLGVALAPPRAARRMRAAVGLPERDGLLVHEVEPDSPAGAAGLQRGDLLVAAAEPAAAPLRRSLRRARVRRRGARADRRARDRGAPDLRSLHKVKPWARMGGACRTAIVPSAVPPTSSAASGRCS